MAPRDQLQVRLPRDDKARLRRHCNRHDLVINDVVLTQLQPLLDRIEREEREAASAVDGRQAG